MLRAKKLTEARNYLKLKVLDNPKISPADKPKAIIERLDVSSPKDGAVFWSGNKDNAKLLAKEVNGVALETTKGGRIIDDWKELETRFPGWDGDPPPNGYDLWGGISKKYASQVSGKVRVIQTPERSPNGGYVWQNAEKNVITELQSDGIVTEIEFIVKA